MWDLKAPRHFKLQHVVHRFLLDRQGCDVMWLGELAYFSRYRYPLIMDEQIDQKEVRGMPKNLWNLHDSPEVLGTHSKATLSDEGSINKKHVEPLQQWRMALQLFQEYSKLTRNIAFFRTNFCSPSTHHRWGETVWHGEKWRCQSIPCWRVRRSLVPFATWKNTRWVPIGL